MKKLIAIAIVALIGLSAQAADKQVTVKAAPLSTAVTTVVQFTVGANRVVKPLLFVHSTGAATTNTPVISVTPASGAQAYTVYTGSTLTSSSQAVVPMNSLSPLAVSSTTDGTNVLSVTTTASPQIVLVAGDVLKITGTAAVWATSKYYMLIEETLQ
jgi:hypothetical protein